MQRLIALAPDMMLDMISANKYQPFREAAAHGHLLILEWIAALAPAEIPNMIRAGYDNNPFHHYEAFRRAAAQGHLHIIDKLMMLAPTKIVDMLRAQHYGAFSASIENGHVAIVERLLSIVSAAEIQSGRMFSHYDFYQAAASAIVNDHLPLVERLLALAPPDEQGKMLSAGYCALLDSFPAAEYLRKIEPLLTRDPHQVQNMIVANYYAISRKTIEKGDRALLARLIALAPPAEMGKMLSSAFSMTKHRSPVDRLELIELLLTLPMDQVSEMIRANDYGVLVDAAEMDDLALMERLLSLMPDEAQNMIRRRDYYAFTNAARVGSLTSMRKLMELLPLEALQMIRVHNY